jgi:hypothetical protein
MTAWMPETMGADMNFASHKSRTVICSAARCEILLAASAWKRRVNEAILSSAGSQSTRSRVVIPEPKFFRSFLFDEGDLDAMNAFQGSQLIIGRAAFGRHGVRGGFLPYNLLACCFCWVACSCSSSRATLVCRFGNVGGALRGHPPETAPPA